MSRMLLQLLMAVPQPLSCRCAGQQQAQGARRTCAQAYRFPHSMHALRLQREVNWVLDDVIAVSSGSTLAVGARLALTHLCMMAAHAISFTLQCVCQPSKLSICTCSTYRASALPSYSCCGAELVQAWRELDNQQWQPCSWQQLDMELSAARRRSRDTQEWQVLLRAPVTHLQQLWHLRLQVRSSASHAVAAAG